MKRRIVMNLLLVAVIVFAPMGMQAQRMTEKLAKKAGVVVLLDANVNAAGTKGNVIYLRLKDKSRSDNWKQGVQEIEVCIETKVKTQTLVPVDRDLINQKDNIMTTITDKSPVLAITKKDGFIEFWISDQYGYRKYKILKAVFYKDYVDALSKAPSLILGIEDDPARACMYISKMFNVYM